MANGGSLPEPDLFDRVAEWGNTISEKQSSDRTKVKVLTALAWSLVFLGSILILPAIVVLVLPYDSQNLIGEVAIVVAIAALGLVLKFRAARLPRNAIQIDYRASELRFGSELSNGVFVRERVASFREIGDVQVDAQGVLQIQLRGDLISLRFNGAEVESLQNLATQIAAARESALRAPIRSRVRSRIIGLEASLREVRSRLTSRFA